jgi:glycosyltransferase involved in cell wall biosynthesis
LLQGDIQFFVLTRKMVHRQYVLADGDQDLPVAFLEGWKWHRPPLDDLHLSDIRPLCRSDPDVVILASWSEPSVVLVWLWALARRKPVVFWIESTECDWPRRRFTEGLKRMLLRRAAACIVPGQRSRAYCQVLGMAKDRVFIAPNATDRGFFRNKADKLAPYREEIRRDMDLRDFVVLFVGRLVEDFKGVEIVLRACSILEKEGQRLSLLVAGDGPDRRRYERMVREEGLREARFLGNLDHEMLCGFYAVADVLVLPSRSEAWGFVLNEGMEFGLPLIVSDAVGAGPDLVPGGKNGFVVPVGDVGALASALRDLSTNQVLRRRLSEASRRIIEDFTPERWAKGVLRAVYAVAR